MFHIACQNCYTSYHLISKLSCNVPLYLSNCYITSFQSFLLLFHMACKNCFTSLIWMPSCNVLSELLYIPSSYFKDFLKCYTLLVKNYIPSAHFKYFLKWLARYAIHLSFECFPLMFHIVCQNCYTSQHLLSKISWNVTHCFQNCYTSLQLISKPSCNVPHCLSELLYIPSPHFKAFLYCFTMLVRIPIHFSSFKSFPVMFHIACKNCYTSHHLILKRSCNVAHCL